VGAIDAAALGPFVKYAHGADGDFFLYFLGCSQLASLCLRHITAGYSIHFRSHLNISAASALIVNSFAYLFLFFVTSSYVTSVYRQYRAAL